MRKIKVYHYDAFSSIPNLGNPAGVVLDGETLTEEQMREIAEKVGFNETAFPLKSDKADVRIRFFTPGHEINLCGHATMATIYALKTKGLLGHHTDLRIETKAGVLPIRITSNDGLHITMKQAVPQFQEFKGSLKDLAYSMGIEESDIESKLPTLYGSTGIWTLLIPIRTLAAFKRMQPNNQLFPNVLKEMPKASIHPFCIETYDPHAHMHARHFSSPFSGTIEDPVTGTASGVMGAYYARYINKHAPSLDLLIEQGHEIGRDGKIRVSVTDNGNGIEVTGNAVYVNEFDVLI
ncbi:PhzF family phenazine biosynthesis isomerase [Paenibacillus sp. ACRRX]|uniref:PhzF family phenazine biosynthesis isomerase n=1 Tax=unclassified Paenibacillus TaxID=185978 RepID=UPI001EF6871D|nr:PhzF family phenazine biosynthesis isomerase [Paenibacillus sp. UMB4589-SE434]MCG7408339.1 PhzF family phenazine biosynthesis isomerase [Paenibacillus sp. ACRRX]MDK8181276.1 PhzF family phenazine biosynthesis isomerase [Paenibacillus sp. UMB4589-SE434]